MGKKQRSFKNWRLVPSAFTPRIEGMQQGIAPGEAGGGRDTDSSHPSPGYLGVVEKKKREKNHPATSLKLET